MTYWRTSRATCIKEGPSEAALREWLDYDPLTGIFIRKKNPRNRREDGSIAGGFDAAGYVRIRVMGKKYLAHRLAWLWVHGVWPSLLVDHIDGNKSNNKIQNLRLVSYSQNAFNSGVRRGSVDLPTLAGGVSKERYRARITIDGKNVHLGSFDTEEEARACYERAVESHSGKDGRAAPISMGAQR